MRHTFYGTRIAIDLYASARRSHHARAAAAVNRADLAYDRLGAAVPGKFLCQCDTPAYYA